MSECDYILKGAVPEARCNGKASTKLFSLELLRLREFEGAMVNFVGGVMPREKETAFPACERCLEVEISRLVLSCSAPSPDVQGERALTTRTASAPDSRSRICAHQKTSGDWWTPDCAIPARIIAWIHDWRDLEAAVKVNQMVNEAWGRKSHPREWDKKLEIYREYFSLNSSIHHFCYRGFIFFKRHSDLFGCVTPEGKSRVFNLEEGSAARSMMLAFERKNLCVDRTTTPETIVFLKAATRGNSAQLVRVGEMTFPRESRSDHGPFKWKRRLEVEVLLESSREELQTPLFSTVGQILVDDEARIWATDSQTFYIYDSDFSLASSFAIASELLPRIFAVGDAKIQTLGIRAGKLKSSPLRDEIYFRVGSETADGGRHMHHFRVRLKPLE